MVFHRTRYWKAVCHSLRYVSFLCQVFELPTVLAYPLFYKLVAPESSVVRKDAILNWMSAKTVRLPTPGCPAPTNQFSECLLSSIIPGCESIRPPHPPCISAASYSWWRYNAGRYCNEEVSNKLSYYSEVHLLPIQQEHGVCECISHTKSQSVLGISSLPSPSTSSSDLLQVISAEPAVRMFDILRKEGCQYVTQADLKSMMAGILLSHPGLEFLQETPEFQDR